MILRYLRNLTGGRLVLWCYFLWYLVVVVRYWDPDPRLWATSLGLSLIIGLALLVNAKSAGQPGVRLPFWPAFRLFMMPFCVSSFAALVKEHRFVLIFSPHAVDIVLGSALCAALCTVTVIARRVPDLRP